MCAHEWGQKSALLCREMCWEFYQRLQGEIPKIGNFHASERKFFGVVGNITDCT